MQIPKEIFKAYDIRGIVGKTLTPEIVEAIGQALGSEALLRKQTTICVGYDGRLSGPEAILFLSNILPGILLLLFQSFYGVTVNNDAILIWA